MPHITTLQFKMSACIRTYAWKCCSAWMRILQLYKRCLQHASDATEILTFTAIKWESKDSVVFKLPNERLNEPCSSSADACCTPSSITGAVPCLTTG